MKKEKKIPFLVKSYLSSIEYYQDKIAYAVEHEGGKFKGYYERDMKETQEKLDILTAKYPEYLI